MSKVFEDFSCNSFHFAVRFPVRVHALDHELEHLFSDTSSLFLASSLQVSASAALGFFEVFLGFSSYVRILRSISASCSRLASSPGPSQVGGSH